MRFGARMSIRQVFNGILHRSENKHSQRRYVDAQVVARDLRRACPIGSDSFRVVLWLDCCSQAGR